MHEFGTRLDPLQREPVEGLARHQRVEERLRAIDGTPAPTRPGGHVARDPRSGVRPRDNEIK